MRKSPRHATARRPRLGPKPRPGRLRARATVRRSRWKHGPIPVIGLVGGIGSGKSQAAQALARRGAFVLDADAIGHALLEQTPARELILQRFGPTVLADAPMDETTDHRPIDRKKLGRLVFAQSGARKDLEAILHPRMRRTVERAIARESRRGRHAAVVLDAAVLFEAGWDDLCDLVAFVEAPRSLRLARVAANRGWTEETLQAREASQLALDVKRGKASAVLDNSASLEQLDDQVDRFWQVHVLRKKITPSVSPQSQTARSEEP